MVDRKDHGQLEILSIFIVSEMGTIMKLKIVYIQDNIGLIEMCFMSCCCSELYSRGCKTYKFKMLIV